MGAGWICWDRDARTIVRHQIGGGERRILALDWADAKPPEFFVYAAPAQTLVAVYSDPIAVYQSTDEVNWSPLPPPPGNWPGPWGRLQLSRGGAVLLLRETEQPAFDPPTGRGRRELTEEVERCRLHQVLCHQTERGWTEIQLPPGANQAQRGAGADDWWSFGRVPSTDAALRRDGRPPWRFWRSFGRVPSADACIEGWEGAVWHLARAGDAWATVPVPLNAKVRRRTIEDGGLASFQGGDIDSEPLVLVSQCDWFFDDPSMFLFTRKPSGEFHVHRLADRWLTALQRTEQGSLHAGSNNGEFLDWTGDGWAARGTASRIRAATGIDAPPYSITIFSAGDILIGICIPLDARHEPVAILGHQGGLSWERYTFRAGCVPRSVWVSESPSSP